MKRKRRQFSGAFKAKVGLEALTGIRTTAQIARERSASTLGRAAFRFYSDSILELSGQLLGAK